LSARPDSSASDLVASDTSPFKRLTDSKFACPAVQADAEIAFDLKSELKQSLANPHFYPALSDSVFTGDRIAISLQPGLPAAKLVLTTLVEQLTDAGVDIDDIAVVVDRRLAVELGISKSEVETATDSERNEPSLAHRISLSEREVAVHVHNPDNHSSLSYLLANQAGEPVYLNRLLVDADTLIPVGIANSASDGLPLNAIYPEFSSTSVRERFADDDRSVAERRGEIREAVETLGAFFAIQLVAGPGGNVQAVFAGAREEVCEMAQACNDNLWTIDVGCDAEIVVATIESKTEAANWDDFVLAIINASQVSISAAPIIVWCDLLAKPSSQIRAACMAQFEDHSTKKMTARMKHFAAVMQDRRVYLRSGLKRGQTEGLGIGHIETMDDVLKIAEPYERGLLLRDAQRCQIKGEA